VLFIWFRSSLPFDTFITQFNGVLNKCPAVVTDSHTIMIAALSQALPGSVQELMRFTPNGEDWATFNAFCHAAKEQVRRHLDQTVSKNRGGGSTSQPAQQQKFANNKGKAKLNVKGGVKKQTVQQTIRPEMNMQISTQAVAATGQTKPLNVHGDLITLAKYVSATKAGICAICLETGHQIRECPKKGTSTALHSNSLPSNPSAFCRSAHGAKGRHGVQEAQQASAQEEIDFAVGCGYRSADDNLDCGEPSSSAPSPPAFSKLQKPRPCVPVVTNQLPNNDPTVSLDSLPALPVSLSPIDSEDVGLMPHVFGHLCKLLNVNPTVDAFASGSGANSLCKQFRSVTNSCFSSHYTGDCVYANPAYSVALDFVAHMVACKVMDPNISLMILLPVTRPALAARQLAAKYMQLSHTFPAGSSIFHRPLADGSRIQCHPCPWPVQVYTFKSGKLTATSLNLRVRRVLKKLKSKTSVVTPHSILDNFTPPTFELDSTLPSPQLETPAVAESAPTTDTSPLFQFPVTVAGLTCLAQTDSDAASKLNTSLQSLFMDTGASVEAIVPKHLAHTVNAKLHKLKSQNQISLTLANGATTMATECCHLRLNVQGMTSRVKAIVIDTPLDNMDIILGTVWLRKHKVILNCGTGTAIAHKGHRKYTLKPPAANRPTVTVTSSASKIHLCTLKTARQALARGKQVYLCLVKTVDDLPGSGIDPEIQALLKEFAHILPEDLPELPQDRNLPSVITLVPGATPQFRNRGRYSQPEKDEMKKQIEAGIKQGKIKPSHSPWGAPVLFVPKTTGRGLRMCVDYRALNNLTVKNRYTLPRIDDLLDQLNGVKYMSSLDLTHGYHQIRLKPEEMPMTAFITPFGLFEFTVMPFGLTNAPSVFQSMMNRVLSPLLYKGVMVYLDCCVHVSLDIPNDL